MWRLTVKHNGVDHDLSVNSERDLLSQMSDQLPFALRKACRNGVCTICRCRLTSGQISYGSRQAHGLWEQEVKDGFILPCIAIAASDVVIDKLTVEISAL